MFDNTPEAQRITSAAIKTFIGQTKDIMFIKDMNFRYVDASQPFADLVGVPNPPALIGKTDYDLFSNPDLAKRYRLDDERLFQNGAPLLDYVEPLPSKDGGSRYGSTSKYIIYDNDGAAIGTLGVSRDITRDYEAKLNYERELGYLFTLPDKALFSVLFDVTDWRVVDFRQRVENNRIVSRYDTIDAFMGKAALSVVEDDSVRQFFLNFTREAVHSVYQSGKRHVSFEYLRQVNPEMVLWVHENLHFLTDPVSGHLSILFVLKDIDAEKKARDALRLAAEQDSLTGLLNRDAVMTRIADFLLSEGARQVHALMMIDLDNFKLVNDTFGHQYGDSILCGIAQLLRDELESSAILGRIGGDEFFAFIKHAADLEKLRDTAQQVVKVLQRECVLGDVRIPLSCSVGISVHDGGEKSLDQLYIEADTALYDAKYRGKNRFMFFDERSGARQGVVNPGAIPARPAREASASHLLMSNRLIEREYDFMALLDAETGMVLASNGQSVQAYQPLVAGQDYAAQTLPFASAFILSRDQVDFLRAMERSYVVSKLKGEEQYSASFGVYMPDGEICYKEWRFLYLNDERREIILTRSNASRRADSERDSLTGLYTRQSFCRHVRERLDADPHTRYMIVRWDIDRFKMFNDTFGAKAGDALLRNIGRYVLVGREPGQIFGRFEADHFVALLPVADSHMETWDVMQARAMSGYMRDYRLSASVGVYAIDNPSLDVMLMCDRALMALLTVKNSAVKKSAVYDEGMRMHMLEEQALLDDFDRAIAKEQFIIYFQPLINYESGKLIGAEALVRWKHPVRGLLQPDQFIPLFESRGYISQLDEYVWDKSMRHLRTWLDQPDTFPPISISVNLSRLDLYDPLLCTKLFSLTQKYRLSPSLIHLEITESAYMDNSTQLISVVKALQDTGFSVEMDDFGAGYSSLNILKDVPVDVLKLDVRFLSKGMDDVRGGNILSSILRMAHWLKLPVIAEGVEEKTYADYLSSIGCIYMQGYFFSKPLPPEEFDALLRRAQMGKLDLYKDVDIDAMGAFWEPSDQTTRLFNSIVGGAAILEYRNGIVEIVRANDRFYDQINTSRDVYIPKVTNTLARFDEASRARYVAMLEEAIQTGGEAECEACSLPHHEGGQPFWTRNRVRLLARNMDSFLFYLCAENITEYKLCKTRGRTRLGVAREGWLAEQLGALSAYVYDAGADILSELSRPNGGSWTETVTQAYRSGLEARGDMPPDDAQRYGAWLLSGGARGEIEYYSSRLDGAMRKLRDRAAFVHGADGRIDLVVGATCEIIARDEEKSKGERPK